MTLARKIRRRLHNRPLMNAESDLNELNADITQFISKLRELINEDTNYLKIKFDILANLNRLNEFVNDEIHTCYSAYESGLAMKLNVEDIEHFIYSTEMNILKIGKRIYDLPIKNMDEEQAKDNLIDLYDSLCFDIVILE